jgi:antirestriction protein
MSGPRIYAACLAAYNNGDLHGRWIDAAQSADDIAAEVQAMLVASPQPCAEEWAIHDYEGFGDLRLSEWESFERVAAIAAGIAIHGDAFSAWLDCDQSHDPADRDAFAVSFLGEWNSIYDYAEHYAEETGLNAVVEKIASPYVCVDLLGLVRDLDIELHIVNSRHHTVYVFDPNAS